MLKPLSIKEAVNDVINLQNIVEFATAIIPAVQENPQLGDEADVYIGKEGPPDKLGTVKISPGYEGELKIAKSVLLKYSGNNAVAFHYELFPGGGGNSYPSEKAFYDIVPA
ncbi:hypothetical protein SAMN05216496_2663 [Pseudomonas sp. Z003-0.4C(8344-21)]|uniref:hypothetical protein n=1 Tax=Pseudomonas sp. Z003-0.4C(8344-21) TaxID=1855380 RepID=UPI000879677D|nr:hypothetical protein [Pseudomonas sp. Z003-0.4C(8344-21)]SDS87739.1 hypothetical protein SAMN05216496_2663 [Pseudomonas sp. Z003-0.4C(8344-21)]